MTHLRSTSFVFGLCLLVSPVLSVLIAGDPPRTRINPASSYIEIADPVWNETNYDIQHVIDRGETMHPLVVHLTANPLDDRRPGLAIAANGDSWVTWWRDGNTDEVVVRKRTQQTGSWSAERLVSSAGEGSRNPVIVHDGTKAWVAYEFDSGCASGIAAGASNELNSGCATSIAVGVINDEPDPIGTRAVVSTTNNVGPVDTQIHAESGHLWVTWIDSDGELGWSEFDDPSNSWSLPAYAPYANGNVIGARNLVRSTVLGQ